MEIPEAKANDTITTRRKVKGKESCPSGRETLRWTNAAESWRRWSAVPNAMTVVSQAIGQEMTSAAENCEGKGTIPTGSLVVSSNVRCRCCGEGLTEHEYDEGE